MESVSSTTSAPLKIMHITRNMPPLVGGMERLNWHLADELSKQHRIHIVAPEDARTGRPTGTDFSGVPLTPLWFFLIKALITSILEARKFRPDIIIAGSGLTAPIAWIVAKLYHARSMAYLHGLDITVNNIFYRWLWLPFIRRMDLTFVNSHFTEKAATDAGAKQSALKVIFPGVTLADSGPTTGDVDQFLLANQLSERKILLSVGRLAARKGIQEFVSYSLPKIVEKVPSATLVVIGDAPTHSLHAREQSRQAILAEAEKHGLTNNIKFLGRVSNETLLSAYKAASVHVFPVKHDPYDPEGFGMVAIEAAAHGVPTAAFATGGILDSVASGVSGLLTDQGDYTGLAESVVQLIENKQAYAKSAADYAKRFSWAEFGVELRHSMTPHITPKR